MEITVDRDIRIESVKEIHADEIFELTERNREFLNKWLPWVKYTKSKKDTLIFIEESMERIKNKTSLQTTIFYKGKTAGLIGLVEISFIRNVTEIGYWLGEEFTGKGIMTKACEAITDHTFINTGLNRINILCDIKNEKSRMIPERLGYFNQGILERDGVVNGEFVSHYHFVMWRDKWKKRKV